VFISGFFFLASLAIATTWAQVEQEADTVASSRTPGRQLVDIDGAGQGRLDDAARFAGEKRYDEAIRELHELMTASGASTLVVRPGDPRQYQPLAAAARGLLATLPDEAIDLYIRRHGATAEELFQTRGASDDETELRRIADGYFHTPRGGRAAARLAAIAFDKGDYLAAATGWQTLYEEHRRPPADRALILAKAFAAYHAAGQKERAQALRELAAKKHPEAKIVVEGQSVPLSAFLDQLLKDAPPRASLPPHPVKNWTSLAGSPSGAAVMPDCDVTPCALWNKVETNGDVRSVGDSSFGGVRLAASRSGGRIRVTTTEFAGDAGHTTDLAPFVHPVVTDGMILCRREDSVVATALDSGDELWRASDVPMYRDDKRRSEGRINPYTPQAGDMGRFALTLADGRLYSVCKFGWVNPETSGLTASEATGDGSSLVALSVDRNAAKVLWEIGNGKGEGESASRAKFLAAPTFADGRLYVLARQGNRYHGMCLDAVTGATTWDTALGGIPLRGGELLSWQQLYALETITERGSPAAVAEGMVFFTTNTGLILALRASTGALVWARQYASLVSGVSDNPSTMDAHGQLLWFASLRRPYLPVNPLIVVRGQIVCLPCDSPNVFALNACNGEVLWNRDRDGQRDLTALSESGILLSGPDVIMLRVTDGEVLHRAPADILGRPAVTVGNLFASGEGCIVKMDIKTREIERLSLWGKDESLGKLVSAGDILVGANAGGLSAFAGFETAWRVTGEASARTGSQAERVEYGVRRGLLAVAANRLDEADAALAEAKKLNGPRTEPAVFAHLRSRLCEGWVRRSSASATRDAAENALNRATACAATGGEKMQVLEETVRFHEKFDGPGRAVEAAQALSEKPPEANASADLPYRCGQREVARLIGKHGDAIYAPFDAEAEKALNDAVVRNNPDALAAVCRRWPHAKNAGAAMSAAAEILVDRAVSSSPPDMKIAMKAGRFLGEARNSVRAEARLQAAAAQSLIDLRFRPGVAYAMRATWATTDPLARVRFGKFDGTVSNLVKRIEEARNPPAPVEDCEFGLVSLPPRLVYATQDGALSVLRNTQGEPVRVGERVFLWGSDKLLCLDTQCDDHRLGTVWSVDLRPAEGAERVVGQLTSDGRKLAVTDKTTLSLFDACTGGLSYRKRLPLLDSPNDGELAGDGDYLAIAARKNALGCVAISDGELAWQTRIPGLDKNMQIRQEVLLIHGQETTFCDDVRTGRTMASFRVSSRKQQRGHSALTPEWLTVSIEDGGNVSVRDIRSSVTNHVRRIALGDDGWRFMGVGSRFVGLRGGTNDFARVLDMADLTHAIALDLGGGARTRQPVRMAFSGNRALLLHVQTASDPLLTAPALTAFELPAGKLLWERELASASNGPCRVSRLDVFGDTVSLSVTPLEVANQDRQYVISLGNGNIFDASSVVPIVPRRTPNDATPVVLNGRVIVEHGNGIACLAGAE
jgi:outer membrane protein assembly factor BamB